MTTRVAEKVFILLFELKLYSYQLANLCRRSYTVTIVTFSINDPHLFKIQRKKKQCEKEMCHTAITVIVMKSIK